MKVEAVVVLALSLWPITASGQLVVAPRRAGQSRVRHTVFDWQHLDLAVGRIQHDVARMRIDEACPKGESPGVRLYFYEGERSVAERAAPQISTVYRELACRFSHLPDHELPYVLYSSYREFLTTNLFPVQEGVLGITSTEDLKLTLPYFGDDRLFGEVSAHEMAHQFTIDKVRSMARELDVRGDPLRQMPLWFVEGLAEYYAKRGIDQEAEMLARDLAVNPDPEIGYAMLDFFADRPFSGLWTYKLGQVRCAFLDDVYGEGTVQRIIEAGARLVTGTDLTPRLDSFAELVTEVTGASATELAAGFAEWIKRRAYRAFLAADQGLAAFDPVALDPDLLTLSMASSPNGRLLMIRTYTVETGQSRLLLLDERAPDDTVTVAADGVPGIESLHPTSGRDFTLSNDQLVYVAEKDGADEIHVQRIDHQAEKLVLLGKRDAWRISLAAGYDRSFALDRYGILAVFSTALAPDGGSVAFVGLDTAGRRDVFVLDLSSEEVVRLTNDDYAERTVSWNRDGIVYNSDATSHGRFNLFRIHDIRTATVTRLTSEPIDEELPEALPDGRVLFTAYQNGAANLYQVERGYTVRVTDVVTGLFEVGPGKDGGVWAMLHHAGRRRPVHLTAGDLLTVERRALDPMLPAAASATVSLTQAERYDPLALSSWELGNIFGLLGAGAGGVYGLLFASATDFLRDHVLVANIQITGRIDLIDGQLFYFNQENRTEWGTGIFQELRIRSTRRAGEVTSFAERFFGAQGILRYPISRFLFLQAGLSVGGAQGIDADLIGLEPVKDRVQFQTELTGRIGYDTVRYHPSTGPIAGNSAILDATLTARPFDSHVESVFRLDAEQFFPLWGAMNVMLRGSAGASVGGKDAREFFLWSWYTLRGVDLDNTDYLLGRYYWFVTSELQVPLDPILRTAIFGLEGIVGLDFGGVAERPAELWDRRVLDVAVGLNILIGPLVLRIHFAWPIGIGVPKPTDDAPVTNVSLGWILLLSSNPGLALFPQACGQRLVLGEAAGPPLLAAVVVATALVLHRVRGRAVDRGPRALLLVDHERLDQRADRPGNLTPGVGRDHARVERIYGHAGTLEASCQLLGEEHVGELRDAVLVEPGARTRVRSHRVEVDRLGAIVRGTGDIDDARGRRRPDPIEQQLREEKVPQVVDAEGQLEAVLGAAALAGEPRVVDEDVEGSPGSEEGLGGLTDRGQRVEVELDELDLGVRDLTSDRLEDRLRLGSIAAGEDHLDAHPCQCTCRLSADPGVGAGDEGYLPAKIAHARNLACPASHFFTDA